MGCCALSLVLAGIILGMVLLYTSGSWPHFVRLVKLLAQPFQKTTWKLLVKNPEPVTLYPLCTQEPLQLEISKLAKYYSVCMLPQSDHLGQVPLLFPEAVGIMVCMDLLSQPEFPFPLIGAIHVKNYVCLRRPLSATEFLHLGVKVCEQTRSVNRGTEVDVEMTLTDKDGTQPWRALLTFLIMHKQPQGKNVAAPAPVEAPFSAEDAHQIHVWDIPEDAGRKYAEVSGDFNPIHLYSLPAKLLGFKRAIAHGMYTTARAYGDCLRLMGNDVKYPLEGEAAYKRPVFLPSKAEMRLAKTENGVKFVMVNISDGKLLQTGNLWSAS